MHIQRPIIIYVLCFYSRVVSEDRQQKEQKPEMNKDPNEETQTNNQQGLGADLGK